MVRAYMRGICNKSGHTCAPPYLPWFTCIRLRGGVQPPAHTYRLYAQAPVGSTDFDELDASDSDAEESDDDTTTSQQRYKRGPLAGLFSSDTLPPRTTAPTPEQPPFGSRVDDYFDNLGGAGDGSRTDVGALSDALFPTEVTENTLPGDRSAPTLHQDMVMRQTNEQARARDRAEPQRARAEWEAVMAASRAAQRDGSVDFSGTTEPFPDHDQAIAGAGLTVHGGGYLSYPGEGLVKDGLSYVANAIHNI